MIEVQNLVKRYGPTLAVDDISFTVDRGEILGFLGPNGAGKSTTMNILTGYLSSTAGTAKIDGIDILEDPIAAKRKIGYLPEQPPVYPDMTVKEYLHFICDLKKVRGNREEHLQKICKQVKIENVYKRLIKNLSKGYRQRVGIAQAMVGDPEVLILDEPTVGLDPHQIIEIRNLIKELGKKHTVILSSHVLSEVQAVCDRVIVINRGKLVADGSTGDLSKKLAGDNRLTVQVAGPRRDVQNILSRIDGVERVAERGEVEPGVFEFVLETRDGADVRRVVFSRMAEHDYPLVAMHGSNMSLEDIFLRLTQGGR